MHQSINIYNMCQLVFQIWIKSVETNRNASTEFVSKPAYNLASDRLSDPSETLVG